MLPSTLIIPQLIFSKIQGDKARYTLLHWFHIQGTWRHKHLLTVPGSDRSTGQVEPRVSWPPIHCSFNHHAVYSPEYSKIQGPEGTGEATLSQSDGPLETEIEPREPPSLNSAVPTPTSFGLSSQFQLRCFSFLSFSRDTFGDETIYNCPSTDSLWQHNWQWVCCKKIKMLF